MMGKALTEPLTKDQCRLIQKLLLHIANDYEGLDTELPRGFTATIKPRALETLALDILAADQDTERTVADFKLDSKEPHVLQIDFVHAVAHSFGSMDSTDGLSKEYQQAVAAVLELAKDSIIERTIYDFPSGFLNKVPQAALRQLVEDNLCVLNDEMASIEDSGPITAKNLEQRLSLVDCLDAFAFRLRSNT